MLQSMSHNLQNKAPSKDTLNPILDKRFLVSLKGKEFVTYAGLLDLAHQYGLVKLEVKIIQFPDTENGMTCICFATAETEAGKVFTDIGDANPKNTSNLVSAHIIRMASTRAKARVLRDITNIGITAFEELADAETAITSNDKPRPRKAETLSSIGNTEAHGATIMSEAQKRAIWRLAKNNGHDEVSLNRLVERMFACKVTALNKTDASALITQLQEAS